MLMSEVPLYSPVKEYVSRGVLVLGAVGSDDVTYRGTLLIKNSAPQDPTVRRGGRRFLMSEVPLCPFVRGDFGLL